MWVLEAERYSLLNLATDALRAGDLAAAEARLVEIEPLLDHSQYSRFRYLNRYQLLHSEVALTRGDHALALRWADEAEALATAKGMRNLSADIPSEVGDVEKWIASVWKRKK